MIKHRVAAAILTVLGLPLAYGDFSGTDNFQDNSKDTVKWAPDYGYSVPTGSGVGVLTETSNRLEFTSNSLNTVYQSRPWQLNFGSYTTNWAVQLDTAVTVQGPEGGYVGFGLEIWKNDEFGQYVGIQIDSASGMREYYSYRGVDPNEVLDPTSFAAPMFGAVQITFDASSKVLTTWYDADGPGNGYLWTFAASYGTAGSGGLTGNDDWGMTAGDKFVAAPFGNSQGIAASAGQTYGDNFSVTTVPEPSSIGMVALGVAVAGFVRRRSLSCA